MGKKNVSVYLCYLLRHDPGAANLPMDVHGWVPVEALLRGVNARGTYSLTREQLEAIVASDEKGRYRLSPDGSRIKACQGHSIPWVIPELTWTAPPAVLYHGTTAQALEKILASGAIRRMERHAVHMTEDTDLAWRSACRWHLSPVLLKIDAERMAREGYAFGVSENRVWCTELVPTDYLCGILKKP